MDDPRREGYLYRARFGCGTAGLPTGSAELSALCFYRFISIMILYVFLKVNCLTFEVKTRILFFHENKPVLTKFQCLQGISGL